MTELPLIIMKEFPADQENDPNLRLHGSSRASTVDIHKARWMALFNQLEQTLSEEEKQLVKKFKISLPPHISFFCFVVYLIWRL